MMSEVHNSDVIVQNSEDVVNNHDVIVHICDVRVHICDFIVPNSFVCFFPEGRFYYWVKTFHGSKYEQRPMSIAFTTSRGWMACEGDPLAIRYP